MKRAIADAKSGDTIYFDAKGEYHFYKDYSERRVYHMTNTDSFVKPEKFFAILLEDKEGITIDGNVSTFVIHGNICALALIRCRNIVLRNFRITYNSPTNYEMTVADKSFNRITYKIPESTHFTVENNSIMFFEQSPFSGENYYEYHNNENCHCNVIHRGGEVFRTSLSPVKKIIRMKRLNDTQVQCAYAIAPSFKKGDTVTMSENGCRDNCGLFFWECSDIVSTDLVINYMHGFGWLSQMCENLTFSRISFSPDTERGYHVSSFADCIHICGCKGSVNISECFFEHPHDDAINIHGAFLRLRNRIDDNKAVFEFVHHQQGGYSNFFKGDKVKLYSRADLSEIGGTYTVREADDDIDKKLVTLCFEETLPPMQNEMAVAENITYNPEVSISDCVFRSIPTRGILITTTQPSEIKCNRFYGLKMPDVYISCDCGYWYESGPCKSLRIHDNCFSQQDAVKLEPICLEKPVANVHENIEIYDNTVCESNGQ